MIFVDFARAMIENPVLRVAWNLLELTWVIWLPGILFIGFITVWLKYKRIEFIVKQGNILLELKLPKDVQKSPLAMELVFTSLYQTGAATYLDTFLGGKIRPWFSFELVSINGMVHFYIWTPPKFRQLLESQLYAQYPGLEIVEAEDYTRGIFVDNEKRILWGTSFKLTKEDVYPIKTYVDYGLDREQEEEFKIDPMTSVLDYLASIKRGNQVWIQIMIQAHRKEKLKDDARFFGKEFWKEQAKDEIKKKIDELRSDDSFRLPTEGEKELVAALERSQSKYAFEVGIRGIYIADKEVFDSINITGLIGSFRQYSSNTLNGFKLGKFTDFDYPWQDFKRMRRDAIERKYLNAYKLRSFFFPPYRHFLTSPFILNTEELATIYHLPGRVATTPGLIKTQSRKGEAPANLPV